MNFACALRWFRRGKALAGECHRHLHEFRRMLCPYKFIIATIIRVEHRSQTIPISPRQIQPCLQKFKELKPLSQNATPGYPIKWSMLGQGFNYLHLMLHGIADGWSGRIPVHVVYTHKSVIDSLIQDVGFVAKPDHRGVSVGPRVVEVR